jgi:hypothetical protein
MKIKSNGGIDTPAERECRAFFFIRSNIEFFQGTEIRFGNGTAVKIRGLGFGVGEGIEGPVALFDGNGIGTPAKEICVSLCPQPWRENDANAGKCP